MSRNFEQGAARGKGIVRNELCHRQEKATSFGSGFSQLFDSGFNQSIVYIHSFVKDSDNENGLFVNHAIKEDMFMDFESA